MTKEEIENVNNPVSVSESEFVIYNIHPSTHKKPQKANKKTPPTLGPGNFNGEFFKNIKRNNISYLINSSKKEGKDHFPNCFMRPA